MRQTFYKHTANTHRDHQSEDTGINTTDRGRGNERHREEVQTFTIHKKVHRKEKQR